MADQSRTLSAAFPTPPPFYKDFTKENVSQLNRLRREAGAEEVRVPAVLHNLLPPEPPADGRYRSFGIQHDVRHGYIDGD